MKIPRLPVCVAVLYLIANGIAQASPPPGALTDKDPQAYNGLTSQDIERMKKGEIVIIKDIGHEESTSKVTSGVAPASSRIEVNRGFMPAPRSRPAR